MSLAVSFEPSAERTIAARSLAAYDRFERTFGVDIRLEQPVERIAFAGRRAIGVEVGGRHHQADAVVVNADFAHAIPKLIPDSIRRRWTDRKIGKARYSCSTFMLYLGVEGEFPDLPHHSILLTEDYRRYLMNAFREAFRLKGTPVRVDFRSEDNPFAGRRDKLTPRQRRTKQRDARRSGG